MRRNGRQDRTPAIAVLTRMAGRGLLTETAIDLRGKHRETWSSACFLGRFARDSPLERDGFEPAVPPSKLCCGRQKRDDSDHGPQHAGNIGKNRNLPWRNPFNQAGLVIAASPTMRGSQNRRRSPSSNRTCRSSIRIIICGTAMAGPICCPGLASGRGRVRQTVELQQGERVLFFENRIQHGSQKRRGVLVHLSAPNGLKSICCVSCTARAVDCRRKIEMS